ncbi:hypothetical protein LINPERHAP2_LOCUS17599 [Linum perenne]
MLDLLGGV